MQSLLRRLREVGPSGALLLIKTFFFLLSMKLALRFLPVRKIIAWKQRPLKQLATTGHAARCTQIRWAVLTAARYSPIRFVCFPQCLAAAQLLHAAGIPTRLHYGVARREAKLMTHTWLEAEGHILIGGEVADAFSTLDVY